MEKLIRKILREHKSDRHYHILDKISEHVHLPYFKSMEDFAIDEKDDQLYIMKKILGDGTTATATGNPVFFDIERYFYDDNGNNIYKEDSNGKWEKYEYDDKGKQIYYENNLGYWVKYEYDDKGNKKYIENSDGYIKYEYDDRGNQIYREDSDGDIWDIR